MSYLTHIYHDIYIIWQLLPLIIYMYIYIHNHEAQGYVTLIFKCYFVNIKNKTDEHNQRSGKINQIQKVQFPQNRNHSYVYGK